VHSVGQGRQLRHLCQSL